MQLKGKEVADEQLGMAELVLDGEALGQAVKAVRETTGLDGKDT
jgi:hypothetical protein